MAQHDDTWRLVDQQVVVTDPWLEVYENQYELPDGSRLDKYHALRERDGVVIVALTPQQDMLLVRQYRPGIEALVYELPAGFVEDGETDLLERAKKELAEETGYAAAEWQGIGPLHDAPHRIKKTTHCFLALNVRPVTEQHQDATEFVRYERVPIARALQMIRADEITSAVMVAAILKALLVLGRVLEAELPHS